MHSPERQNRCAIELVRLELLNRSELNRKELLSRELLVRGELLSRELLVRCELELPHRDARHISQDSTELANEAELLVDELKADDTLPAVLLIDEPLLEELPELNEEPDALEADVSDDADAREETDDEVSAHACWQAEQMERDDDERDEDIPDDELLLPPTHSQHCPLQLWKPQVSEHRSDCPAGQSRIRCSQRLF